MSEHIAIVGAGQAAAQAAASLRQSGYAGRLTLFGSEPELPYQRPPLSKKYLTGELTRERLAIRPASFFAEQGIALKLGEPVTSIDVLGRQLSLAGGERVPYDRLLLATGARPRMLPLPGADLPGTHVLRSLADADRFLAASATARRLVVIGGGYIGLEVAASMTARGFTVTVLEAAPRIMSRVVGAATAAVIAARHAAAGVTIHCGMQVDAIIGRERAEAVLTRAGETYAADLVLVAAGIEPVTDLAERAGIACTDGIVVDEFAATEAPGIYAAGDCTNFPSHLYERRIRLESVHNAIEQAKTAAASMTGTPRPYADVPWFWSHQYEFKLQIAGLSQGHDSVVVRGADPARGWALFYLQERSVIAVDAINDPRSFLAGKKLIAAGMRPPPGQLGDPSFDLNEIVPAG